MERCSPRSRYGRVHLDLFTTPRVLTAAGRLALESLASHFSIAGKVTVSSHDAAWDRVVFAQIEPLARAVLRAVHNPANYKLDLPAPATLSFRQREVA